MSSPSSLLLAKSSVHSKIANFTTPTHVDWRKNGVIGPLKSLSVLGSAIATVVSDHCGTDSALKMGTYKDYSQ